MQINRWPHFTEKGHLFYFNDMQINRWPYFTEKGHHRKTCQTVKIFTSSRQKTSKIVWK